MERFDSSVSSSIDQRNDQRAIKHQTFPSHLSRDNISTQQKQALNQSTAPSIDTRQSVHTERRAGEDEDAAFSGRSVSNLKRFLDCTTPRMTSQFFSKSCVRDMSGKGWSASPRHFFSLGDLWDSFDEWSAYGAGVPIVINGKETVVQYYVPYVSALQLYTTSASGLYSKNRRLGDDSDGSEVDFRDTSSEASSDGEADRLLGYGRTTSRRGFPGSNGDPSVDCRQSSISNMPGSWSTAGARGGLLIEDEEPWQEEDRRGRLAYQFFETAAPCIRVPLYDKIGELAREFCALKNLRSTDLSPSSWLSVAWYPIYRIPTGPTLRDLAACFLTYHSLSTLLPDNAGSPGSMTLASHSSTYLDNSVALHPFGLASYKFRGSIWTSAGSSDRQNAMSLQRNADDWLKRLHVQHPDYDYFMSRSPSMRR